MIPVLPTRAITDLNREPTAVLNLLNTQPVVLLQRSQPAAVMVLPAEWNATAKLIDDLRAELARERRLRLANQRYAALLKDPSLGVDQADYERGLASAGLEA